MGSLTVGFTGLMVDLLYTFDDIYDIFTIDDIYDTFTFGGIYHTYTFYDVYDTIVFDDIYDTCREIYYYILYYYSPEHEKFSQCFKVVSLPS